MFTPPPRASQLRAGIPVPFDEVIATGMAKDPNHRYPTTIELAAAAHAAGIAVPASPRVFPPSGPVTQHRPPSVAPPDSYPQRAQPIPAPAPPKPPLLRASIVVPTILAIVLVAAGITAVNLFSGSSGGSGGSGKPSVATPSAGDGTTVKPTRAVVFSPQGEADDPDGARFAIDGNPATAWITDTYTSPPPFPGFKNGVGLVLELPHPTVLSAVIIDVPSTGTVVQIRSTTSATPAALEDTTELSPPTPLQPGRNTIAVNSAPATSNVLVWISTLGSVAGQARTEFSEITLEGR
jgi:putative peptidoglycan lipid II flippase